MKLTKAQISVLHMVARRTLADGSGHGAFLEGANMRVGNRLADMGLVDRMASWPAAPYARITPAGRAALSLEGE